MILMVRGYVVYTIFSTISMVYFYPPFGTRPVSWASRTRGIQGDPGQGGFHIKGGIHSGNQTWLVGKSPSNGGV